MTWKFSYCSGGINQEMNKRFCQAAGGNWVIQSSGTGVCENLPVPPHTSQTALTVWQSDVSNTLFSAYLTQEPGCAAVGVSDMPTGSACTGLGDTWRSGLLISSKWAKRAQYYRLKDGTCDTQSLISEDFSVRFDSPLSCPIGYAWMPIVGSTDFYCRKYIGDMCPVGNPVDPASGEKLHSEPTLTGLAISGLLRVYYRSYGDWNQGGSEGLISNYWRFDFDRRIHVYDENSVILYAAAREPQMFRKDAAGVYNPVSITREAGKTIANNATGFLLTELDRSQWQFGADGRLKSITYLDGRKVNVAWSADTVVLTDQSGRSVLISIENITETFGIYANLITGKRIEVSDQSGQTVTLQTKAPGVVYAITSASGTRTFQYEDPAFRSGLTGIIDELGVLHRRYTYVSKRVSEEFMRPAGSDVRLYGYTYTTSPAGTGGSITITNPLNQASTANIRTYGGVRRLYSQTENCASCGSNTMNNTYNLDGTLSATTDLRGVRTEFLWDVARNLETQRIEAKSAPGVTNPTVKRTIQTDWHANFRVPTKKRYYNNLNVLEQLQSWSYNDRGQVTAQCVHDPAVAGATTYVCGSSANAPLGVRQTTYSYLCTDPNPDPNLCPIIGQLASTDGPRTDVADVTTLAYYQSDAPNCAGNSATCDYRRGDLHTVTNALGHVTEYVQYDLVGRLTRIRDPNGVLTDYVYDTQGRVQQTIVRANANGTASIDDEITSVIYEAFGDVKRVTQPDGSYLEYLYDSAHRMTGMIDNLGNQITYTLDAAGNRTHETTKDAQGNIKRLLGAQFDGFSRLKAQINAPYAGQPNFDDPSVKKTSHIYDMNGNLDLLIDPLGRTTDHDYDELNRLKKTVQDKATGGINATTQMQYDTRDNLRKVTDPKGLDTIYTYDGLDNQTQLQSPDTGTTLYTHDRAGNVLTQTDARGVVVTHTYDALNRLASKTYPDSSLNEVFTYDQDSGICGASQNHFLGRLTQFTDGSGSTAYCYDRKGQITVKLQSRPPASYRTEYAYTAAGRLATMTYPSGARVRYERDGSGRVISVYWRASPIGVEQPVVSNVSYLPFGPIASMTWATGTTQTRTHDQNYWIDQISSSNLTGLQADFTLDDLGNITGISDGVNENTYQYDALYRLTGKLVGGQSVLSYAYDATGNRLSTTEPAPVGTQAYIYPSTSHRLLSVAGTARQYDANGNLTNPEMGLPNARQFSYGDHNRLKGVTQSGQATASLHYNAKGERTVKERTVENGRVYEYVFDEAGHLIGEYSDQSASTLGEYVWIDDIPVALMYDGDRFPIETDQLGTPRRVMNTSTAVWSWDLLGDPFGNTLPDENPDGDASNFVFNLRFPGQYSDQDTKLNYNYFRDYEPGTGRYVESDPIGLDGGRSTYSYVLTSPLLLDDFYGLQASCAGNPANAAVCAEAGIGGGAQTAAGAGLKAAGRGLAAEAVADLMTAAGNTGDSQIEKDWERTAAACRLNRIKEPDRCDWLREMARDGFYTPKRIQGQAKKWQCKGSRWKDSRKARPVVGSPEDNR